VNKQLTLIHFPYKVNKTYRFDTGKTVDSKTDNATSTVSLQLTDLDPKAFDNVIVLQVSR